MLPESSCLVGQQETARDVRNDQDMPASDPERFGLLEGLRKHCRGLVV